MLNTRFFFTSTILLLFITSCTKVSNDGIPAYVKIDSIALNIQNDEGTALHNISDLWIESEGENFGAMEYPTVFPALVEGERDVIVNAGIKVSGNDFEREIYPFFKPYNTTVTFSATDTVTINPSFEYKDNLTFALNETFESSNIFSDMSRTSSSDAENLEGRAGTLHLDENTPLSEATTATKIAIPKNRQVYLEMHFKAEHQFQMGIEGFENGSSTGATFFADIYPVEEWTKVYIHLSDLVIDLNATEFNFFFSAQKFSSVDEADIYVDNIKIIYQ